MNIMKKVFQHSNVAARIYTRKKTIHLFNQSKSISQNQTSHSDKEAFHSVLTDMVNSIVAHPGIAAIPDLESWLKKFYTYNLTGGKAARGLSVVTAYETLVKPENITEESMRHARILGWCVEMFQSYLVIMDDIMDGSSTRRGHACWHLLPEVGTSCAMSDAILLYNSMLYAVKKHFYDRPNYNEILDTINEAMLCTAIGQFLDIRTSKMSNEDYLKLFTPDKHLTIVKFKTAYYTYDLPIHLGSLLAGNKLDGKTRKQVQDISLDLGSLFQIQDDFIDCYGDESQTGKAGTDIQEGKCSWLAVSALQRCNEPQRVVFKSCYGSNEPAHVERIKRLYDQLQLPELFMQVERQYYDGIMDKIKELPTEEWKCLFYKMLGVMYKRKK